VPWGRGHIRGGCSNGQMAPRQDRGVRSAVACPDRRQDSRVAAAAGAGEPPKKPCGQCPQTFMEIPWP